MAVEQILHIGVLALQGGFHEHASHLAAAAKSLEPAVTIRTHFVRTAAELAACDALVIPGGESTTITLLAEKGGLLAPLRDFVRRKPTWGSCAGMIVLSESIYNENKNDNGGSAQTPAQAIGGVDICIVRNQYGRQLASFEHNLTFHGIADQAQPFPAVFIRAPIIHHFLKTNDATKHELQVLATVPTECLPQSKAGSVQLGPDAHVVALRQGNILVTSFHPELSQDTRVHEFFIKNMVLLGGSQNGQR